MRYPPSVSETTGTQAIARALVDGGIAHASAFPGSPATVLAQALEAGDDIQFRWAVNENTALSHAFGAAMAGRGAMASMKHVGVNVALDALQVMGVVHTLPAPLILIEGADARPGSSQSAQDNRPVLAGSAGLLVLAPTTVQEAYDLTRAAIDISRAFGMIVVVRGDARMFKATGTLETDAAASRESSFSRWPGRGWALATSARTYPQHLRIRRGVMEALAPFVDGLVESWGGDAPTAAIVAGHLGHEIASPLMKAGVPGLRLLVENPLPEARIIDLLSRHERVAVLEECLPALEHRVREIAQRHGLGTGIIGRRQLGDTRPVGWLAGETLDGIVSRLADGERPAGSATAPALTRLPTGLVEGRGAAVGKHYEKFEAENPLSRFPENDPRHALFTVLRELGGTGPTFIATDPGITGVLALGGARSDVKMHMGAAVPIAAGWSRAEPEGLAIAVVGDTNLPHSEWLGLVESAAAGDDLLVVIADNGHSEMTQRIVTLRPSPQQAMASLGALGICVKEAHATTKLTDPWAQVLREAAATSGPRLVWLHL
jgi:indolepyruvate ferredoxin oxidoreductase alpha subunit